MCNIRRLLRLFFVKKIFTFCNFSLEMNLLKSINSLLKAYAELRPLFYLQAEDCIRDLVRSRGLGNVYKKQVFIFTHKNKKPINKLKKIGAIELKSYNEIKKQKLDCLMICVTNTPVALNVAKKIKQELDSKTLVIELALRHI